MEITEVRVFPVSDPKLRAFVSIVFDHCFMVNDIRVIEGKQGLFISMPNRRRRNGDFKDVAHPLNQETRNRIEERVLAEYRRDDTGTPFVERTSGPLISGAGEPKQPEESVAAAAPAVRSLEEVQEAHLSESFWSLGE